MRWATYTRLERNTTISKIGGPWESWPGSLDTDGEWGRCAKNAFDDAPCLVRYAPIFCRLTRAVLIGSLVPILLQKSLSPRLNT